MGIARNIARLIPNGSGELSSANIAAGAIVEADIANLAVTAGKLAVGKYVKQMKHVRLDSQFLTTSNGNVTALSLTFDNSVTVNNQILVMASGVLTSGTVGENWGTGCDLFIDSTCITSSQAASGSYTWQGATEVNSDSAGGVNFGLKGIGIASNTNPTISLKINRQGGWDWTAVGYSFADYGKASTNLVAIEFGV